MAIGARNTIERDRFVEHPLHIEAAADEIYVKDPVLMVVEPESLCWLSGRMSDEVSGEAWARAVEPA